MGGTVSSSGIDVTKQFRFTHVKELCILFPRYPSDYTVMFNPCLEKLTITMFNHDYPDKETDTTSARFLRSQLEAMGLYTILQCTESLEHSYTTPPRYLTPTRDRSFFDGLDSGPNSENVTLSGKLISDKDGHKIDTYHKLTRNDNTENGSSVWNKTPPILCLVTDTFWLFTSKNVGTVEYNTKDT
jgi:hypothetical protein